MADAPMKHKLGYFSQAALWRLTEDTLPPFKATLIKSLKIAYLAVQGFTRDICLLRASALTLYSLLSIVPIIAMLFGIAKGFGFEKILEQHLLEQAPPGDTLVLQLISFAHNLLDSTKGEVVAGIGIIVLFWTIISVIGNIEESFNFIWKIPQGRSLSRKFSDYLSLMLLAPVVLIASSSITVLLKTEITWLISLIELPAFGSWLVIKALGLSSLILMMALFAFMFIFMPNHPISHHAGIIAGIVTGILYAVSQWAYISLQIGVSSYNAIYGSFAALPLFVVWLQTGWMIVLLGCELAFYIQNYDIYRHNDRFADLSFALKKIIALQVTHLIVQNFSAVHKPLTALEIADKLTIPIAIIQPVLFKLTASHILMAFKTQNEANDVYEPAMDTNHLTIAFVINALEQCGQNQLSDISQAPVFMAATDAFRKLMESSEQNCLLKDIVGHS